MKLKNFRLRNRGLYYFFPGWNTLPFFNRKSKSVKHSVLFPSDHSPNRLIPQSETKRAAGLGCGRLERGVFKALFFLQQGGPMKPTHALRKHHDELRLKVQNFEQVLTTLPHLSQPELERAVWEQVLFLREDVKSHAAAEEASLYPEVDALAVNPAFNATATMEIDHEYIAGYIERLAEMRLDISLRKVAEFQRVGWELAAILKLHFDKEERVYLPLLDAMLSEKEVQKRIVEKMDVFEEAKWST